MMDHMQGGPSGQRHIQSATSYHGQPRRDYHAYAPSPQSPMHPQPYMTYHAPYYPHPPHMHYQQPRWHPQQYPQPQFIPPQMQIPQYPPRSPMMMSPHRPSPMPHVPPQNTQSPRPIPQYIQYQPPTIPQNSSPAPPASPSQPPSSVPTVAPQQEPADDAAFQPTRHVQTDEYKGPLPWYFPPGEDQTSFSKASTSRRRRRRTRRTPALCTALLETSQVAEEPRDSQESRTSQEQSTVAVALLESQDLLATPEQLGEEPPSEASTVAAPSESETPATSHAPSEHEYHLHTGSSVPIQTSSAAPKSPLSQHIRRDTRSAIAVPNITGLPKAKVSSPPTTAKQESQVQEHDKTPKAEEQAPPADNIASATDVDETDSPAASSKAAAAPATKSWADLVRRNVKPTDSISPALGVPTMNGTAISKSASLADALKQYNVRSDVTLSFLEPRGLVNTGNMCYMNSILQVLVFCAPFYNFLDQVRQRTVHSLKSDTPLVDAMIMFMREFNVLASAESSDALRKMLKQDQVEVYGEPVTPEYVYDVIRKLPRFAGMRRGHQQDAEEFLGFLLEGLHDECAQVMLGQPDEQVPADGPASPTTAASPNSAEGWQEVGPKQKAATTRTAGHSEAPTPITKIFGGHLRSELRVPGLQPSAVYEPFKPLQLDIGAQDVNNIIDALKGLTRVESLTGQFGGRTNTAKKQVFIHDLPPVLILHLKRFQYDNNLTGTQKIWKKVGYPLELEIPKEVFAPGERKALAVKGGAPRYRLIGVVYHHGKSAAGGHYTVDVLRQDSREWVRMDDTVIRRVRPEDVAEGGAEEDPKILAKALEQHSADQELQKQRNIYQGLDEAEKEPDEEMPWSEVNGHVNGHGAGSKKWGGTSAAITNGAATPNSNTGKPTPTTKREGVRDNKVAYILLYERMMT